MNARYSLDELISVFGKSYRTIDTRAAATREGEAWVNALAVVRLTYEEPPDVSKRLRELERSHGSVETKHFRIVTGERPFVEWDKFLSELAAGVLRVGDVVLALRGRLTVASERAYLSVDYAEIRPFDDWRWPVAHFRIGLHEPSTLIEEAVTREVSALGYSHAYDAINVLCEVNVRLGQSHGYDFTLSVPVFAQIAEVRILPGEKRVVVAVRRQRDLADVRGAVFFRGRDFYTTQPSKARVPIAGFSPSAEGAQIEVANAIVDLPDVEDDDWVEAKLLYAGVGEINQLSGEVRRLIPPAERNILFEALKLFCAENELEELFVRAHEQKPQTLNESAVFERHVSWLLGLFGLSAIVLGKYEHVVASETKVRRGSVDILAASQRAKVLFLIACSLGAPEERDFNNLLNVREILSRQVYCGTEVRVLPVVFTAARGCPSYREVKNSFEFIPIIDADGLETLLELLKAGQEARFFQFLSDPRLNELRKPSEI